MARYEMLFFSDADHVVPPNVLAQHERRHRSCHQEAIVIGNVFGRRTALTVEPDCRPEHKGRLLDILRFDKKFETVASTLAVGETVSLGRDSNRSIWSIANDLSFTDRWTRGWATLLIEHGENLQGYAHRWTRVSSGSMSITARIFTQLGGFDESFWSMEDWEFGLRAQQNHIEILCAPESEPYHQIHGVDTARARYEYEGAHLLAAKHSETVSQMLHEKNHRSPAAASIEAMLKIKVIPVEAVSETQTSLNTAAQSYCVLTFDDGPHAVGTPLILEVLQRYNCQATFFFLGLETGKYKDLARQTAGLGHEIGIHGWAHTATRLTAREHFATLSKAIRVIEDACGTTVRYTRPPYGNLSASYAAAAEQLNLQVVGWDLSAEDYAVAANAKSQSMNLEQVIFVGGSGRSGTTLICELLDLNSESASIFEVWPLITLLQRFRDDKLASEPLPDLDERQVDFILSAASEYNWRCSRDEVVYAWTNKLKGTLAGGRSLEVAIRCWLDYLHSLQMIRDNSSRIVHKTPALSAYLPEIWQLWPEARFLHMIRDPRGVIASYMNQGWGPKTISEGVDWYCKRVGPALVCGRGDERYVEVKLEDLVSRPAELIDRIQCWASLPLETGTIMARHFIDPAVVNYRRDQLDEDSARLIYNDTVSRIPGLNTLYAP
jgi:peptidoglycan/xylan/chitin deacetylase (PgdA/CDA1 family)